MALAARCTPIIMSKMIHLFDWSIPLDLNVHYTVDHEEDKCRYMKYLLFTLSLCLSFSRIKSVAIARRERRGS